MNIFHLHENPVTAAELQCDKHVVKMALESVQILCAIAHRYNLDHRVPSCYKPTHQNHPCVRWAGDTRENFVWLLCHATALCLEYRARFGRRHKSSRLLPDLADLASCIPVGKTTPPPLCMPENYHGPDAVEAYRAYYYFEKSRIADYRYSERPDFMYPEYWTESMYDGQYEYTPAAPGRELAARVNSVDHDLMVDINATDLRAELLEAGVSTSLLRRDDDF